MKLISLIFLFCLAAEALTYKKFVRKNATDIEQAHQNCENELKPTPELYAQFVNFKFPKSEITDCYVGCVLEKLDLYSPVMGFLEENLMTQLNISDPHLLRNVQLTYDDCNEKHVDSDDGKYASDIVQCVMKRHGEVIKKAFGF